jgi:pyridoxal biosynthesis lyase PdxS
MEKHSDDWDMETISESAHICAATIEAYCEARCTERERLARIDEWNHIELYPFKIVYVRDDRTVIEAQERIDELQKQSSSQEGE